MTTKLQYGRGPMADTERGTIRAHALLLVRASLQAPEHELAALTELVDGVPRYELVRIRLAARLHELRGGDIAGYDWTLEQIKTWCDGISEGKASSPTCRSDVMGAAKYFAEWPDGDWKAWERHPIVSDLWREVGAVQDPQPEAAAVVAALTEDPNKAQLKADAPPPPPAVPPAAVGPLPAAAGPSNGAAAHSPPPPASTVPAGASKAQLPASALRPADYFRDARVVRAPSAGVCAVVGCQDREIRFQDLEVMSAEGLVAHFHCGRPKPKKLPPECGPRIVAARKAAGITQAQLAAQIKVTAARLSDIERGKGELERDQLGEIASFLGVTLHSLEQGAPPDPLPHPAAGDPDPAPAEQPEPAPTLPGGKAEDYGLEDTGEDAWH